MATFGYLAGVCASQGVWTADVVSASTAVGLACNECRPPLLWLPSINCRPDAPAHSGAPTKTARYLTLLRGGLVLVLRPCFRESATSTSPSGASFSYRIPQPGEPRPLVFALGYNKDEVSVSRPTLRAMPDSCVRVSRGLMLFGQQIEAGSLDRQSFLERIEVKNNAFRSAGDQLGATRVPGLRFFDSTHRNQLAFGPGAGLVLGVSVGASSIRAAIVDANGRLYHAHEDPPLQHQLALAPSELLERLRRVTASVFEMASSDPGLLVDGAFPFLGVAVAWGAPLDREKKPLGPALQHRSWHSGAPLHQRVARHLGIPLERSHALNHAHAAAIAVAWHQTRAADHLEQHHSRIGIVIRLAGEINAATIVVEPPRLLSRSGLGPTSGFLSSVLIGGVDLQAGEIGHVPVDAAIIASRNYDRPSGLGDLVPFRCSCTEPTNPVPSHLEAYASTTAIAHRVSPAEPEEDVIARIVAQPEAPLHRRVLQDVGILAGHTLVGPVAMLNPATITLTGPFAVPTVQQAVSARLSDALPFGVSPEIRLLRPVLNDFVGVQGAALAVLRRHVHRRFEELVGGSKRQVPQLVRALTVAMTDCPWRDRAGKIEPPART